MRRQLPAMLLLLVLTGCGAGGSSASKSGAAGSRADGGARPAAAAPAALVTARRQVVRTASIAITVDTPAAAADQAVALAREAGGVIESDRRAGSHASLVLRIPPSQVPRALTSLSKLGQETSRDVGDKDVTEQSVDLQSRLATQRASVERVRALLARASSLTEIATVEGELTRREAELESLQNRSRALSAQVDLASLTVELTGRGAKPAAGHDLGFLDGLDGGWQTLVGAARVTALVVGAVLPFLPLLLVGLVGRVLWRRHRSAPSTT